MLVADSTGKPADYSGGTTSKPSSALRRLTGSPRALTGRVYVAQPHLLGVGKAWKWRPLWGEHVLQGVQELQLLLASTRASASDSTSRENNLPGESSEVHFHDHLSDVGVSSLTLSLHLSPNKTDPSFCRHRGARLAPALGEVQDAVPRDFSIRENHFLHHPLTPQ